eukprot:TRINITY_DN394_c0_g2_i1.p1 TRINITY_DN394_c0_g2~~TRINITY_DN394_c0_g2_i1.p1  ORF type:complete len:256 (+),score=111.15 TRINITY_DN394_c0_g2_i1:69-836(+)
MASTLSGPNIEEEYLWSCKLTESNKEYTWSPKDPSDEDSEDESDPSCKPNHRLLVKLANKDFENCKDDLTVLSIETKGYQDEKISSVFLTMKKEDYMEKFDLLIPDAAKIKLVKGSGPITLLGSHCLDFYDYRNYGGEETEEEEDAESSEDDEMDMEEQETVTMKEDSSKDAKKSEPSPAKKSEPSPAKETDKKKTPKKDTPKKESKEEKSAEKESAPKSDSKKSPANKKTPDSKKRKPSEEIVAEKKRKKSDEK